MAVKIKLQRKGSKNKPFYRVVVQSATAARDGDVVEILGQYDPRREPTIFNVDQEKTKEWLAKGAEPTEKVRILLGKAGILPPVDLAALKKKKPKAEEKAEAGSEEKAAPAEAPTDKPAEAKDEGAKEDKEPKVEEKKEEAKDKEEDKEKKEVKEPEKG